MKKKNLIIAISLAIVLVMLSTLAACGSKNKPSTTETNIPVATGSLQARWETVSPYVSEAWQGVNISYNENYVYKSNSIKALTDTNGVIAFESQNQEVIESLVNEGDYSQIPGTNLFANDNYSIFYFLEQLNHFLKQSKQM